MKHFQKYGEKFHMEKIYSVFYFYMNFRVEIRAEDATEFASIAWE